MMDIKKEYRKAILTAFVFVGFVISAEGPLPAREVVDDGIRDRMSREEISAMDAVLREWTDERSVAALTESDLKEGEMVRLYGKFSAVISGGKTESGEAEKLGRRLQDLFLGMPFEDFETYGKLIGLMRETLYIDGEYYKMLSAGNESRAARWAELRDTGVKEVEREYLDMIISGWGGSAGGMRKFEEEGFGTATLPDGSVYKGNFRNGLFNGKGVLIRRDGRRYEGDFKDGMPHGRGVETWRDGTRYEGEFRDGKWHGKGLLVWENGEKFKGEFRDGVPVR